MSVSRYEQQSGHGSTREPEDFLAEILERLRAEGVRPLSDGELADLCRVLLEQGAGEGRLGNRPARLAADLLEARAKLDAVRKWAEQHASEPAASEGQAVGRLCGREVLEILYRQKARES